MRPYLGGAKMSATYQPRTLKNSLSSTFPKALRWCFGIWFMLHITPPSMQSLSLFQTKTSLRIIWQSLPSCVTGTMPSTLLLKAAGFGRMDQGKVPLRLKAAASGGALRSDGASVGGICVRVGACFPRCLVCFVSLFQFGRCCSVLLKSPTA